MNLKGGTAKTTTAVNLAASLAEKNHKVLLIDFDPQAAASKWLDIERGQFLYDVLIHDMPLADGIQSTSIKGLDVIPSDATLSNAEKAITQEIGYETILRDRVKALPGGYDYILIDCPPSLGALCINALTAADAVLIPVEAHALALDSLSTVIRTIQVVRERLNPKLSIAGILAVRVDIRTILARDIINELKTRHPKHLLNTIIRINVRLAESPSHGLPITEYDTASTGAADYRALAVEILNQAR